MTTPSIPDENNYVTKPPLSIRHDPQSARDYEIFNEAIPDSLRNSLYSWVEQQYTFSLGTSRYVHQHKLHRLERKLRRRIVRGEGRLRSSQLLDMFARDETLFLDGLEIALLWAEETGARVLNLYLLEGGSSYRVGRDENGNYELQRRQSDEMQYLADQALSYEHRASEHLRRALSKCFGRDPEPRDACSHAVQAVEAAAKPVVIPKNDRATLSDICKAVEHKPSKWETDTIYGPSVETVLEMMKLVWNNGKNRHGDDSEPIEVPQAMAEMTVEAAVVLVNWYLGGRIRAKG